MSVCWREGVAFLFHSSLSARFFNFTAHFPLMSFSHTHPLIFMGNRQAAAGLLVAGSRRQACKITGVTAACGPVGGGIAKDSEKFSFEGGGKGTGTERGVRLLIKLLTIICLLIFRNSF